MVIINTNQLKGKIVSAGYNQKVLAEMLGVSKNTLSDKINGKSPMNSVLISELCRILNITDNDERVHIFLPALSQKVLL